ncbi:hypothetical protein HBN50_06695 [Halobacteriovorax sp. GB3]|uniref:hypothetical protein n=1 Tax=Halobacteriovorax sp. GB3 TaxID=2719615 RepID=UPI00235DECA6|nr:hypothetical protein [Halobacteriovorax sp. GB3]MDD0852775.1 hypothetical protein [Halobacteriovorax sp. GB3]
MKKALLSLLILPTLTYANIPTGNYQLQKIICTKSNETIYNIDKRSKYMNYYIGLDIQDGTMRMKAVVKALEWNPAGLFNCTQYNSGKFSYKGENQYEGYLDYESGKCNIALMTRYIEKRKLGTEAQGLFTYKVDGRMLTIQSPNSGFSCVKSDSKVTYIYKRD